MSDEPTIEARAESLANQFSSLDVSPDELAHQLRGIVDDYGLATDEAERTLRTRLADRHHYARTTTRTSEQVVDAGADLDHDQWVDLEVELLDYWPVADDMSCRGLLGDATGTIEFVAWHPTNFPDVPTGESIRLTNVHVTHHRGSPVVTFTNVSGVEPLARDIDCGRSGTTPGITATPNADAPALD